MLLALTLPLWTEGTVPDCQPGQEPPFVEVTLPERRSTDALLIVAPGGSYEKWGAWEAASAKWFAAHGMATAVLHYRVPRPKCLPKHQCAWEDAQRAVRLVRSHAAEWKVNPESIGFIGFSAGGNLAIRTAVSSQTPAYARIDALDDVPCHVNWAVVCYPAYVLSDCKDYDGTNRQKGNPLDLKLDPSFAFDAKTPPICFLHGDDDSHSPMGSVRIYHKLRTMGIPAELHVYAKRRHADLPKDSWKPTVWTWLCQMKFVGGASVRTSASACSPQDRNDKDWWAKRHADKLTEIERRKSMEVVFLGDSITHYWENGRHVANWRKWTDNPKRQVLNLGFSGDRTEHVLWRIAHGELDGYRAKAVVLMIGTNNTGSFKRTEEPPENVAAGVRAVLGAIRAKQPQAKIVLCAILPRGKEKDLVNDVPRRNDEANSLIRRSCDGKDVIWCDFGNRYLDDKGAVDIRLLPDLLHPSDDGYDVFAEAVFPILDQILGLKEKNNEMQ